MKKVSLSIFFITILLSQGIAQSLEGMGGHKRIFMDAQWLKPLSEDYRWTLFSRSRATVDYEEDQTDLFTGAYLNYTTKSGFGGTVLGRIGSRGAGGDVGIHYFKSTKNFMVYALPTVEINEKFTYGWFSIMRYRPTLNDKWKLYTSLELFSTFEEGDHIASVQRIRLGLDFKKFQFGFAMNLSGLGEDYDIRDENLGIFLRREFE